MRNRMVAWLALLVLGCEGAGAPAAGPDTAEGVVDVWIAAPDALAEDLGAPAPDLAVGGDTAALEDVPTPDLAPAVDVAPDLAAADDVPPVTDVPPAEDVPPPPPCPTPEALAPTAVTGRLYEDGDRSSRTLYLQTFDPAHDAPLPDVSVALLDGAGVRTTTTCPDGAYAFGGLADGLYVVAPEVDAAVHATSTNRGPRFAAAIREGALRVVAFGDSVPVYSPDVPFPARLGTLLAPLADTEVENVAVSGSISSEWLPSERFFRDRLAPLLGDADVVVFTLGGNDVLNFLERLPSDQQEAAEMLAQIPAVLDTILANVEATVAAIRERAPEADIVYCLYPDYPASAYWEEYLGTWISLVKPVFDNEMARIRTRLGRIDGIVLADLYSATRGVDVTSLLIDPLHLSDEGADVYAAEVFRALGGVIVTSGETVPPRSFGFAP